MAKKQNRQAQNVVDMQVRSVGESSPNTVATAAPTSQEGQRTMTEITLQRKSTQKNGVSTFSTEGIHASVYFNKTFWNEGKAPDQIKIVAFAENVIAEPGSKATANAVASVTPERAAKAEEAAKKSQERLEKAQKRATEQAELAKRLKAALSGSNAPADAPADAPAEQA